ATAFDLLCGRHWVQRIAGSLRSLTCRQNPGLVRMSWADRGATAFTSIRPSPVPTMRGQTPQVPEVSPVEHVVFFPTPDGSPAFRRLSSLEEAVDFVEHLRNEQNVREISVHT